LNHSVLCLAAAWLEYGVLAYERGGGGSLRDQIPCGDVLKAFACLGFCDGAGKYSKLTNDAKKVESSIVDEAYCGCSEVVKWEELAAALWRV
jgi:hypothetical protein